MRKKTTHVRIEKDLLFQKNKRLPELTANEVFKWGLITCDGIKKTNRFLYGKKNYEKMFKK